MSTVKVQTINRLLFERLRGVFNTRDMNGFPSVLFLLFQNCLGCEKCSRCEAV